MEPCGSSACCPACGYVDEAATRAAVFVVTGASGSGKTAVLGPLARALSGSCVTFDVDWLLDAAGSLSGSQPIHWPALRDAWLPVAHGVAQAGMPTVLLGPLVPEHLEILPARRWVEEIHYLVLDCPDDLRRERIQARPVWRHRDLAEQVEFAHWLRRNIPDRLDTSMGSPHDTALAVAAWITGHLADDRADTQ